MLVTLIIFIKKNIEKKPHKDAKHTNINFL